MVILLDIDGVLVTEKQGELMADGFSQFDERAAKNLSDLVEATNAQVVLTSTHRFIFSDNEWISLFRGRGICVESLTKVNDADSIYHIKDRYTEIKTWVDNFGFRSNYVILDDDYSLYTLPMHIANRWVMTDPTVGLDDMATGNALNILMNDTAYNQ